MSSSEHVGSVYFDLELRTDSAEKKLNKTLSSIIKTTKNAAGEVSDASEKTSQQTSKAWDFAKRTIETTVINTFNKAISKSLDFGKMALQTGIDFESSMAKVSAIGGATGEDLEALTNKARDLGKNTQFSASEVADGLSYMAMAGWDTQQSLDGIDGVLQLAAASGTDLALTSDIVTDALTGFGYEAPQPGI